MDKDVIDFANSQTWINLVEDSLDDPEEYLTRLSAGGIECSYWDCSGLTHVFSDDELHAILKSIQGNLDEFKIRLYHGCRLLNSEDPQIQGLKISSTHGIEQALLNLAKEDAVLNAYEDKIRQIIDNKFTREQAKSRNGQIWFGLRYNEIVEQGGVYCAFGSEYRLMILNSVDPSLKERLLCHGVPSIVVVDVPIVPYLERFRADAAKYLLALWIHQKLKLDDRDFPSGFSCWMEVDIPSEFVNAVLKPDKVHDRYNSVSRWYAWDDMVKTK